MLHFSPLIDYYLPYYSTNLWLIRIKYKENAPVMENICENLVSIQARIRRAEQKYGYPSGHVQLLAVSKYHPITALETAFHCEQRAFGENYVQEMQAKVEALRLKQAAIEWHFIGPIQSNKTKAIAHIADWVHSVGRLKIAQRLSDQKPPPSCRNFNLSTSEYQCRNS